ncbi:MAG: hypothetical protein H8E87_08090, partial [FCB group bacterium]|nr:hypothetical protein [FCB group bacterium]
MNIKNRHGMFSMKRILTFLIILTAASTLTFTGVSAEVITYSDSWGESGFNLIDQDNSGVEIVFSITNMYIEDLVVDNQVMKEVQLPGIFLPNDAGAPNLPGTGRYIAMPVGASAKYEILSFRTEIIP